MFNRPLVFIALGLSFVAAVVYAEDKPAAKKFAEVHQVWKDLDAKLGAVIEEFASATPDRQDELRKEYDKLSQRGKDILPQLRKAALAAYTESPNEDDEVVQVLVGVMASDVYQDEYEGAMKLAKTLLKHDCKNAGFHQLAGTAAFCTNDFQTAQKQFKLANEAGSLDRTGRSYLDNIDTTKKAWAAEEALRAEEAKADDLPRVKLSTSKGDIIFELFENEAPQSVANFVSLVEKKFYDGLTFHRVLPGFMAQGGDPEGTGSGGPGYNIYCECHKDDYRRHFRGTLSMAHAGRDTGGSQFFLTFRPTPHLDGRHTAFGRVVEGMDVLAKIQRIDPNNVVGTKPDKIVKATVIRKRDHEYLPTKVKDN